MRPKVLLPVLAFTVVLLALLFHLRPGPPPRRIETKGPTGASMGVEAGSNSDHATSQRDSQLLQPSVATAAASTKPADVPPQNDIAARIDELNALAMKDDQASLTTILSEITDPEPEIRKAALEAVKQFASRDAIPSLAAIADQTSDSALKTEISKVIDFLKLPSLSEVIAQSPRPGKQSPAKQTFQPAAIRPPQ